MNVRFEKTFTFTAGFHYDNTLSMTNYFIKLYMVTNTTDSLSQNIALGRVKHFIWNNLNNTVFISEEEAEQCNLYLQAGINLSTLPAEPFDQIVGIMLYSKLNAIMESRLVIDELEISSDAGDNIVYLHSSDENLGPIEKSGWWHDPDMVQNIVTDDAKIVTIHQNNSWREFDLSWPDEDHVEKTGNIVVFANFKDNNDTK